MIKMVSRVRDISILWISAVKSSVPRTPAPLKLLSPKFQLLPRMTTEEALISGCKETPCEVLLKAAKDDIVKQKSVQ